MSQSIHAGLARLARRERDVVLMRYFQQLTLRQVGEKDASRPVAGVSAGHQALDLSAGYKLGSSFRIVARIENLLRRESSRDGERVRPTGTLSLQGQL